MATQVMKIEVETETCCICGSSGELMTPEEYDIGAPPMQVPLRAMLLHLNNCKVVPEGRLCEACIRRTLDAFEFSSSLSTKSAPPLSEKIRALRRKLHELTQKIDVFIVVGGPGENANGQYNEEDIIMVEREALAAAAAADDEDLERARNARGDTVYQCSVCPLSFQRVAEYRAHAAQHPADALHCCWACGAQFNARAALRDHAASHAPDAGLTCHLCSTTFQSAGELRVHEATCPARCPACGARWGGRAALAAHVAAAHAGRAPGPAVCAECFRCFPCGAQLAAHEHSHRQARHFVCGAEGCILRFAQRGALLQHIRGSHAPAEGGPGGGAEGGAEAAGAAQCAQCGRSFASTGALRRHERVHRGRRAAPDAGQVGEVGPEAPVGGPSEYTPDDALQDEGAEGGEVEYLEVDALDDLQ